MSSFVPEMLGDSEKPFTFEPVFIWFFGVYELPATVKFAGGFFITPSVSRFP